MKRLRKIFDPAKLYERCMAAKNAPSCMSGCVKRNKSLSWTMCFDAFQKSDWTNTCYIIASKGQVPTFIFRPYHTPSVQLAEVFNCKKKHIDYHLLRLHQCTQYIQWAFMCTLPVPLICPYLLNTAAWLAIGNCKGGKTKMALFNQKIWAMRTINAFSNHTRRALFAASYTRRVLIEKLLNTSHANFASVKGTFMRLAYRSYW